LISLGLDIAVVVTSKRVNLTLQIQIEDGNHFMKINPKRLRSEGTDHIKRTKEKRGWFKVDRRCCSKQITDTRLSASQEIGLCDGIRFVTPIF